MSDAMNNLTELRAELRRLLADANPSVTDLAQEVLCLHKTVELVECLRACIEKACAEEREACARACEQVAAEYQSPEYATGQPSSTVAERFACKQCAEAIRERGNKATR